MHTLKWCSRIISFLLVVAILLPPPSVFSGGRRNKLNNSEIWRQFALLEEANSDTVYTAQRELISMGPEVIPYAFSQLRKLDDIASIQAGFLLSELQGPEIVDVLIATLRESRFKGGDDVEGEFGDDSPTVSSSNENENGTETETVTDITIMSERARAYRDGFCCLALGLQGQTLNRNNPEQAAQLHAAVEVLRGVLDPDKKNITFARVAAILGLGLLGDGDRVKDIAEIVKDETQLTIFRIAGMLVLSSAPGVISKTVMEDIAAVMPENKKDWRQILLLKNATLALGNVGDEGSVPLLVAALSCEYSPVVRMHSWLSLGELGAKQSLPELRELIQGEKDDQVLISAARAFWQLGDFDTAYQLLEYATTNKKAPRGSLIYATQILGSFTDARARDVLLRLLNHSEILVQRLAASNLVKHAADKKVSDTLFALATRKRSDSIVRQQAVLSFAHREMDKKTFAALAILSKDKNVKIRRAAALAFAFRPATSGNVKVLRRMWNDKSVLVRSYAAVVYGTMALEEGAAYDMSLDRLAGHDKSFMVRGDASLARRSMDQGDMRPATDLIDEFVQRESLAPRFVWEEFWQHQFDLVFNVALEQAAQEGAQTETTTTETEPIIEELTVAVGFDPDFDTLVSG